MPGRRRSSVGSTPTRRGSAVKYKLIDPEGQYKLVKKGISDDCVRQKCLISLERHDGSARHEGDDVNDSESEELSNYFGTRITVKLLNSCFSDNCTSENIAEQIPGITEMVLHVSDVPTMSVLLIKSETPSKKPDRVELRYYSSAVDLNGIDSAIFQGLSTRAAFKLYFNEFIATTSEFSFDVVILGTTVLSEHTVEEIPKKSKFIIQALGYIFHVDSEVQDEVSAPERRKKEDIDWFYGQVKKYHATECLKRPSTTLQHPQIIPTLREYQQDAVNWMLYRESEFAGEPGLIEMLLDKMYTKVTLKRNREADAGVPGYFNHISGYVCLQRPTLPPLPTGGILADEMGLGKTVEVLSLIMLHPKPTSEEEVLQTDPLPSSIRRKRGTSPCEFRTNKLTVDDSTSASGNNKRKLNDNEEDDSVEMCRSNNHRKDSDGRRRKMEEEEDSGVERGNSLEEVQETDEREKRRTRKNRRKKKKSSFSTKKRKQSKELSELPSKRKRSNGPEEITKETRANGESLYKRVKSMYDIALNEFSSSKHAVVSQKFHGEFFNPHVGRKAFFECICGEGLEEESDNVVTCGICSSSQHKSCVGFNLTCSSSSTDYLCPHCAVQMPPIPTKTTLIVTPNTIAHQWINEIRRHVGKEHMKILFYKGTSVHGYVPPKQLAQYDLIITTYGVLAAELDYVDLPHSNSADGRRFRNPKRFLTIPSPLPCILFWRICLDEAQMVEGISTRMASMALKLHGVHNWCVTGTPLNKGLEDLYGLFLFLGIVPVSDSFWWYSLVTNPFYQKDASLLYELFGRLIWRNGKRDVLDQLGIPPQSQIVHWLNFSPVEAHFYKRLYDICGMRVLEKVQKICQNSAGGLTIRLSSLDRQALHELVAPFLELRQACCHPQLVGHSVSLKNVVNETITMEELLTQLIQKTKAKCSEAHRALVGSLNGAAGIHWIMDEHVFASNKYREILQLSTKHEKLFKTDTLQMLHTLENLAELLDMNCPGVPYTLRDSSLRGDADALRAKYLENHASGVHAAYSACQKVTEAVDELRDEFQCVEVSWWSEILYEAMKKDKVTDLLNRIKDVLEVYASKKTLSGALRIKFEGPASFQKAMVEWLTELERLRTNVLDTIKELLTEDPASFVESCVACHLRQYSGSAAAATHDFRCRLCVNLEKFSEYQHSLFSEDLGNVKKKISRTGRNRQKIKITGNTKALSAEEERLAILREEEELIETTGHVLFHQINHDRKMLGDSCSEKALRQLITFGRINKLPAHIMDDGAVHLKLYDTLKKEFKLLRVLWTKIYDQVSAIDELSQATTRLSLRSNLAAQSSSNPPRALTNLDHERAKRLQEINLISYVELQPRLEDLQHEYEAAQADFNVHHGQLVYLEQLEKKNQGKKNVFNEEDCPVCHNSLGSAWTVLVCGHSFCSECIKKICHHPAQSFLCPLCRHTMKMADVSFVDISPQTQPQPSTSAASTTATETRSVRGSHSTKVQAVVEQLLQLQISHPGEKVIIFSSWSGVLEIIGRALEQNGILFAGLSSRESKGNFQKTLRRFQERANIQVLLLPLISGSKGLNIIEATHVFLVEPILNMASEHQAIGRIHRIGQTKPTFVHRFYVRNTIEEHLYEVLKGHDISADQEGMLSLGDLKELVTK